MKIQCVDFFCGAGGLTYGLERAGIDVRLGIDADPDCQFPYETNTKAKFKLADIRDVGSDTIRQAFRKADFKVLAGCAPCQPFSTYTQGRLSEDDSRWSLLATFANHVKSIRPDVVTMENVWKLNKHSVFSEFVAVLSQLDYQVAWSIVDCKKLSIPQTRKRLVLIASRHGGPLLPQERNTKTRTVKDAIGKLPRIDAGSDDPDDPIHVASRLSEINLKRIKASRPGGTWRDWPEELIANCHTKETGRTFPGVYGRMEWNKPSPTITGQCYGFGNGRFGHPSQDRAISLREAALLQTFPRKFQFVNEDEVVSMKAVGLMIGNAVPPKLGAAIGRCIVKHLKQHYRSSHD